MLFSVHRVAENVKACHPDFIYSFEGVKKPALNIGILLLLIMALPPLFFTSYEVGSYYQHEQMIDSIYTSQLESVIFSVNQYGDDVVSGWASQLFHDLQNPNADKHATIQSFIQQKRSVERLIFASDSGIWEMFPPNDGAEKLKLRIDAGLKENDKILQRLVDYSRGGYRKIQPISIDTTGLSLFVFAFATEQQNNQLCGFVVNSRLFISENLGPKIQSVAGDEFYLSVFDGQRGAEVYSNELRNTEDKNIEHMKPIWLMPEYKLGIRLRGETIEDLVQSRMRFGVWMIAIVDIVMILAAIFIYRAIRQQMKLARLKSDFVSNVSHEIRTPLAVINMYSETLEMGRIEDEKKKQEYYKIIHTETNRLSGIVNKILSFSKIEGGKRNYKFRETDVNELTAQIIQTYSHHFKNKGMACSVKHTNNLPAVKADAEAVTDAMINLIDNAIKYSGEIKKIEISTGISLRSVYIDVKDYGIGIAPKHQKIIFDKFYRVTSGHLANKAKGTGIGLSIVKQIMEAHQGSVTLKSDPGKGSTFRLSFPISYRSG